MRILVVEDEPALASILVRSLSETGHLATAIASGEHILVHETLGDCDAIVLDVDLPGIDGVETCRRLRARGFVGAIVMISARGRTADVVRGREAGADDCLVKPFPLAELEQRLRTLSIDR